MTASPPPRVWITFCDSPCHCVSNAKAKPSPCGTEYVRADAMAEAVEIIRAVEDAKMRDSFGNVTDTGWVISGRNGLNKVRDRITTFITTQGAANEH